MLKINVGELNFKKILELGSLYVDKTLFIRDLIAEGSDVTLITRPRRFGNTLNMSMLKYFFDGKNKEEHKTLFNGLNIRYLWTLIIFSGYLTKIRRVSSERYDLKISNEDIKRIFRKFLEEVSIKYIGDISALQRALYKDDYINFVNGKTYI